jgi:hypothetical protein
LPSFGNIADGVQGSVMQKQIHGSVTQARIESLFGDQSVGIYWGLDVGTGESHILNDGDSFAVGVPNYDGEPDVYGVDTLVLALGMLGVILNDDKMRAFLNDCASNGITPDVLIKARAVVSRAVNTQSF